MSQQLIPISKPDRMIAAGLPFDTTDKARWCYRNAEERGLSGAFILIGNKIHICPDAFHRLARGQGRAA